MIFFLILSLFLRNQDPSCTISGTVTMSVWEGYGGDSLVGASIMVFEPGSNDYLFGEMTSTTGQYEFNDLIPGIYRLEARMVGFHDIDTVVTLSPGQDLSWNPEFPFRTTFYGMALAGQHWWVTVHRDTSSTRIFRIHYPRDLSNNRLSVWVININSVPVSYHTERMCDSLYRVHLPPGELNILWNLSETASESMHVQTDVISGDTIDLYPTYHEIDDITADSLLGSSAYSYLIQNRDEWIAQGTEIERRTVSLQEIGHPELSGHGLVGIKLITPESATDNGWQLAMVFNKKAVILNEDLSYRCYDLGIETKVVHFSPFGRCFLALNALWDHGRNPDAIRYQTETGDSVWFSHPSLREERRAVFSFDGWPDWPPLTYLVSDLGSLVFFKDDTLRIYDDQLQLLNLIANEKYKWSQDPWNNYRSAISSQGDRLAFIEFYPDTHSLLNVLNEHGELIARSSEPIGGFLTAGDMEHIVSYAPSIRLGEEGNSIFSGFDAYRLWTAPDSMNCEFLLSEDGSKVTFLMQEKILVYDVSSQIMLWEHPLHSERGKLYTSIVDVSNSGSVLCKIEILDESARGFRFAFFGDTGSLFWLSSTLEKGFLSRFGDQVLSCNLYGCITDGHTEFIYIDGEYLNFMRIE
ncbi:MAG: hypothetical protein GF388_05335 [Candidatus Aegiribacteria sp.]|nr:hypothetical protein [Candidatus Aegiribacteria sp.]